VRVTLGVDSRLGGNHALGVDRQVTVLLVAVSGPATCQVEVGDLNGADQVKAPFS